MKDDFGDRMKLYESLLEPKLMPSLPTFARVDGRAFHTFTKGLARPFDINFRTVMKNTAIRLAKETNAVMTYTQSDEITLMWYTEEPSTQLWFNGRHSKMVSQIAALATLYFYTECQEHLPDWTKKLPSFDARVWQTPNKVEAVNVFRWREQDATRNSIQAAAQSQFSHKQLHGKNTSEQQKMLLSVGVDWNVYPDFFKRGMYFRKFVSRRHFSTEEIKNLPKKHAARSNPDLVVERTDVIEVESPFKQSRVINLVDVVFNGMHPITKIGD